MKKYEPNKLFKLIFYLLCSFLLGTVRTRAKDTETQFNYKFGVLFKKISEEQNDAVYKCYKRYEKRGNISYQHQIQCWCEVYEASKGYEDTKAIKEICNLFQEYYEQ